MFVEVQGVNRWPFGRLMHALGPIRIAVPTWRLPRHHKSVAKDAPRVSQQELIDLFHSELRTAKPVAKRPDPDFTSAENLQRQCIARLRTALYD